MKPWGHAMAHEAEQHRWEGHVGNGTCRAQGKSLMAIRKRQVQRQAVLEQTAVTLIAEGLLDWSGGWRG